MSLRSMVFLMLWGVPTLALAASFSLGWNAPAQGIPEGYLMYRKVGTMAFELVAAVPVEPRLYREVNAPMGNVCYYVTAYNADMESGPSNTLCLRVRKNSVRVVR